MKIVAFDAKSFQRTKRKWDVNEAKEERARAFISQLGVGVTVSDPQTFTSKYIETSQDLREEFDLDYSTPFFSSACLKDKLSLFEAAGFTKKLVSSMQDHIESVHCSYIVLPTPKETHVEVGGVRCAKRQMPAVKFIESLGPAFSYLTALSYIWEHESANFAELEMHIDAFRSRYTVGWNIVKKKAPTKIFYRGDECNPFISCADMIAFLVDDLLTVKRLKLFPDHLKNVLQSYKFGKTVHFFDSRSINHYTWKIDQMINVSSRLARPIVFLGLDSLTAKDRGQTDDTRDRQDRIRSSRQDVVRQTDVYQAALKYAYQKSGCMKLFAPEDIEIVKSGDVFVHAGPDSARTGKILQDMAGIEVLSAINAIELTKNTSKHFAD